ncbi:outer membrane beta-barrel family protein [Sphingobacterium bovistauri]|uniref:TonB-dependent receptor n=1 Tax=Sphingobacterium bovistauri TaxID=2781959 RepID=A0ABS7Z707_9SPHI|nr:outer membrane beta-barrel family protein [Sphingobacterium bovistauri]MCA5005337.1 TonB-dependent receptor [Sphingobacterium bovistauri]
MKLFSQIFGCMILCVQFAVAQQQSITGYIKSTNNQPIANASVYLVTEPSKGFIKSAVTDEKGQFKFLGFPKGTFRIEATAVGYVKGESNAFVAEDRSIALDDIMLRIVTKEIEAVSVQGQLPQIQYTNGRLVMNVENSSISAGNNALEVLKRAPGVDVDKDDNISLMGQQGVNVMIDGRQTYMTGEQLATFLKSTDGGQIKSIELSTTRSAKDDAEGTAGVINIVMKKNRLEGFNGSYIASGAFGEKFRGNTSLNVNYKKNNSTFFTNYSYTDNNFNEHIRITRVIPNKIADTYFDQSSKFQNVEKTHNYKLGFEQKTSARNTFMIQFNGANNKEAQLTPGTTLMSQPNMAIDSIMVSDNNNDEKFNRYSVNMNNEFVIDSTGKKLTADFDYSTFKTNSILNYSYFSYLPDMTLMYDPEYERSNFGVDIKILAAKLDYTQKLWKGNVESGLKYSNVKSDNDVKFENLIGSSWLNNTNRSNVFNYTEQIVAGYFDYSTNIKKWGIKAGLRGEYTISDGHSITQNKQVKRDYLDLFPSASLSYNAHENHVFAISYARKVSRPNYRNLNPFEYYVDKRTYNKGNPYLNPQYTDGFSFNYTLYKRFNIALGHDITKGAMVESLGQDTTLKTTWIIRENLGEQTTSYINLTVPLRIGKVWTLFNNITGIYMHFKGPVSGYEINQGSAFIQGNINNNFKFSKNFAAELSVRYNSPFIYNMYKIQTRWGTDIGASYNFKDERTSLKLAVTDVFHTNHNNVFTEFKEYNSKIYQYRDSQTVRLTLNYKFGNLKQSIRKVNDSSEEKERAL